LGLLALAVVPEGAVADRLALTALFTLGLATAMGWLELAAQGRCREPIGSLLNHRGSRKWLLVTTVVGVSAVIAVQTWFRPGTTIAGGDLVVPDGTAWIGKLFEPWTWGGSALGEPSQLPEALPWAAILGLVHRFGGDAGLAQRIWDTAFFVGAGWSVLGLLAALRFGPIAALTGVAVYLFNPYVVTWVNTYDVYYAALLLLAALPAVVVAAGTGRLSVPWSAALFVLAAPLIGWAFLNPPLVGMIFAATLAAPLLAAWVDGKDAAWRSLRALLLASLILLAASAYWTVPALLHLAGIIPSQLVDLAGWHFTEIRASIRNAFWLNTHWGWDSPEYFPYAKTYDVPIMSVAKFVLPALAFSVLALPSLDKTGDQSGRRNRQLRLGVAAATAAVLVIFLSTGTNPPGNVIFDRLYGLPFGWLLREPARFVMVVVLAYTVLIATLVSALLDHESVAKFMSSRRLTIPALRLSVAPLALGASLLVGFPLYTGAIVSDSSPTLPAWAIASRPTHVQMPTYWTEMARVVDRFPIQGAVLLMPPDDFYEMPYTWYYGTDAFVVELFNRRVLVPNTQGYTPASSELIGAVNLTGQSILHKDWRQTQALATVLNAPLILVRRDIVVPYPNHTILPPNDLAAALETAPNFALIQRIGPLELFSLREAPAEAELTSNFMMVNSPQPDLRLLSLLPPNTALVSGTARVDTPIVVQSPPLETWQIQGNTLTWHPTVPYGWAYRVAELDSQTIISLSHDGTFVAPNSQAHIAYASGAASNAVSVTIGGQSVISNGDFGAGLWRPVTDCRAVTPGTVDHTKGSVIQGAAPGGLPALKLAASAGAACVSQPLNWHGGGLLLTMSVKGVQGAPPRICVFESGPNRCAPLLSITPTGGWSMFRASVSPDSGTTALELYLYADANQSGTQTICEYADVRAVEVPNLPSLALLANPEPQTRPSVELALVHSSFSPQWRNSVDGEHIVVDGMLNGWLIPAGSNRFSTYYMPASIFGTAQWVSAATMFIIFLIAIISLTKRNGRLRWTSLLWQDWLPRWVRSVAVR